MPTTNPVPSADPSDLLFNAGRLDEVVNGTANSFTDRLGATRRTVAGMNADFDAQLADAESDLNVYRADAAASAAEALGYLQTIRATSYGAYASDPATDPLGNPPTVGDEYFNTTSNLLKRWNGTTWQASDINTANLAASSGSSLVGHDGGTVQDVLDGAKSLQDYAALRAYTGRANRVYVTGLLVTAKPAGIAGTFQYDPTDTTSTDNGGTILVGSDGRRWKRDYSGAVNIQWFGAKPDWNGIDGTNNTQAINAAMSASNSVYAPEGSYLYSGVSINRNNFALYGDGESRTIFVMDNSANAAVAIASTVFSSGIYIHKIRFDGNVNNAGCISLGTTTNAAARIKLEDLFITGFSNQGASSGYAIRLNSNQNTSIHNVWTQECHYGVYRANGGYSTSTRISGKGGYYGRNQTHGFFIDGQCDDLDISDVLVEGCLGAGIYVTQNAANLSGVGRGTRILIDGVYFEENNKNGLSSANAVVIAGTSTGYAQHTLTMERCQFAANPSAPAGLKNVSLDRVDAYIGRNRLIPDDVVTTATCNVRFDSNKFPNAANYLSNYKALLGNITATDFVAPLAGTDPNQVNFVNAITFPAVSRPVNDPNTLDDYQEGTWTPVLTSVSGTVSSVDGAYTKIGNLVFFSITIQGTGISVANESQNGATLPFTVARIGSANALHVASPRKDLGFAYISNFSGGVLLLPAFAEIPNAVINISGQYLTTA